MTKYVALVGILNSLLFLANQFGASLSDGQLAAIGVVFNAIGVFGAAYFDTDVPWFGKTEEDSNG